MKTWSRSDRLALTGIIVGIATFGISLWVTTSTPESRRFVGWDCGGYDLLGKIFNRSFCQTAENSLPPVSEQERLHGTWEFKGNEGGQAIEVLYHIRPTGTSCYEHRFSDGSFESIDSKWNYSNGSIFEESLDGSHVIETSIEWVNPKHIKATIKDDNKRPHMRGVERNYYRI